jgi:hypothetical protein
MCVPVLVCLLAAGCGGNAGSPSAPSVAGAAASSLTPVAVSRGPSASASDLARCFSGSGDAVCFSGARPQAGVATAGAVAPGAPGSLTATSSNNAVTISWSAPASGDPVVSYILEAGSAAGLANLANFNTGSTATSFSQGNVATGTYYVRVRAQNAGGTSAASNEATLVVGGGGCTSAPLPPTFSGSVSGTAVSLSWAAASSGCPATSFVLQAGSKAGGIDLANANMGAATSYSQSGLGAGTYYIRALAANAYGSSGPSNEVALTIGSATTTNVTGTWLGLVANGDGLSTSSPGCLTDRFDVQLVLTQTGSSVSGTATSRVVVGSTCNGNRVGATDSGPTSGTVSGSSVSLRMPDGLTFSATVSGNRMSGPLAGQPGTASAALVKQ